MIKNRKIFIFMAMAMFLILAIVITPTISNASPIDNPEIYRPGGTSSGDTTIIVEKSNKIIGTIVTVGTIASVVTLLVLGIKYMVGSVEEKAEYKKSMIPYLVGAILLFSTTTIVSIIANITKEAIK